MVSPSSRPARAVSFVVRAVAGLVLLALGSASASAGDPPRAVRYVSPPLPRAVIPANSPTTLIESYPVPARPRRLGSFYPDEILTVRSNFPAGAGYSPGGLEDMTLYGPFSPLRASSSPLLVYQRGYNGVLVPTEKVVITYPNQPNVGPFVYPTQRSYRSGFPESGTPPAWKSGINWIDLN